MGYNDLFFFFSVALENVLIDFFFCLPNYIELACKAPLFHLMLLAADEVIGLSRTASVTRRI